MVRNKVADKTRCAIYARFSSEKQRDASIEDQIRVCRDYAAGHGLSVAEVYSDRAQSGTSDQRPAFQQMIADAKKGMWATLLVYKLDRFARDRYDSAMYRHKLRECGVELVSAMEAIPDTPEGAILESVLEGFNEYYSRNLSQNVLRGMVGNAEKCLANGATTFGYRTGPDGRYEIDEKQARLVTAVFEMADSGYTRREIARFLNDSGSRNTHGNKWKIDAVSNLLRNEKYKGVYFFADVRVEGGIPAIVDKSLWERVNSRSRLTPRVNSYPLSGKLLDAETGIPYRGTSGTSYNGTRYLYYSAPIDGKERRWPKEAMEDCVRGIICDALMDQTVAQTVAERVHRLAEERAAASTHEALEHELEALQGRRERLLDLVESGAVDMADVSSRLAAVKASIEAVEESMADEEEPFVPDVDWLVWFMREKWGEAVRTESLTMHVLRCFIDEKGHVTVELRWPREDESETKEIGEPAGESEVRRILFGSPYTSLKELLVDDTKVCLRGKLVK